MAKDDGWNSWESESPLGPPSPQESDTSGTEDARQLASLRRELERAKEDYQRVRRSETLAIQANKDLRRAIKAARDLKSLRRQLGMK